LAVAADSVGVQTGRIDGIPQVSRYCFTVTCSHLVNANTINYDTIESLIICIKSSPVVSLVYHMQTENNKKAVLLQGNRAMLHVIYSTPILGSSTSVILCHPLARHWANFHVIIFKNSKLYDHGTPTSETDRWTND